ncbi:hypothetical protein Zmor_008462 [Zophobas morio]|uniref:Uncharacterized protein n=1 Tax=Zophobas morio TaxID=2755281 RepID=A0AA38MN06_9CUCU|nr:hypothetical protein Zmor_008462 [Zophobas morio]
MAYCAYREPILVRPCINQAPTGRSRYQSASGGANLYLDCPSEPIFGNCGPPLVTLPRITQCPVNGSSGVHKIPTLITSEYFRCVVVTILMALLKQYVADKRRLDEEFRGKYGDNRP